MSAPEPDPAAVADTLATMVSSLIADQQAEIDKAAQAIEDLDARYQSELAGWEQRQAVAQAAIDQFTQWQATLTTTVKPLPPVTPSAITV